MWGPLQVHIAGALQVFCELDQLDQLLETSSESIGLMILDEKLPLSVLKFRKTSESGAL